jgi:Rho-binding antiterminator
METPRPYRPIDCSVHDRLESLATLGRRVEIVQRRDDAQATHHAVIVDVYTHDAAEYLRLDDGTVIRLDELVSVDGTLVTTAC